jgi:hypothetical protein
MKLYYIEETRRDAEGATYLRKGLPEGFVPCSLERANEIVEDRGGFKDGPAMVFEIDYDFDLVRREVEAAGDGYEFSLDGRFEGTFVGLCRLTEETRRWVLS